MDHPAHQTKIRQWLDETQNQMTGFLESMNEREGELIQKRQENRQLCNEYIAQLSKRQSQARRQASAILSCMQDPSSTRGNPSSIPAAVSSENAVVAPHQDPRHSCINHDTTRPYGCRSPTRYRAVDEECICCCGGHVRRSR